MSSLIYLELLDWRRRVAELFAELRARPPTAETLHWFRTHKDALFRDHPQSPIPASERPTFTGLQYWDYDPGARAVARFTPAAAAVPPGSGQASAAQHADAQPDAAPWPAEVRFFRVGTLEFDLHGQALSLGAYWIDGYAGGLFVPFRDATSGTETYGAGRYALDTIKSADLGSDTDGASIVLDFNYAYHPSCAYDPRWVCPLAPPENRLNVAIRAGEKLA